MSMGDFSCPGIAVVKELAILPTPLRAESLKLSNDDPAVCNADITAEPVIAFFTVLVALVAADAILYAILLVTQYLFQ